MYYDKIDLKIMWYITVELGQDLMPLWRNG